MQLRNISVFLGTIAAATAQTGQLGNAGKNPKNPAGAAYQAILPKDGPIQGSIVAVTNQDQGVDFAVNFENLPKEGGPFPFHIHVAPVPADGNCTGTLGHLDPYIRGETPACDPAHPETCQVGDLSGKYGKANDTTFNASFTDPFVSLTPGLGAFFGNRSFVIHYANTTRITCANFTWIGEQAANATNSTGSGGNSSSSSSSTPTSSSTTQSSTVTESVASATAKSSSSSSSTPTAAAITKSTSSTPSSSTTGKATSTSQPSSFQGDASRVLSTSAPLLLVTTVLMWAVEL